MRPRIIYWKFKKINSKIINCKCKSLYEYCDNCKELLKQATNIIKENYPLTGLEGHNAN